jgi:uncharacterized membrane protein YgdD (TMEM256/DUF423 family)
MPAWLFIGALNGLLAVAASAWGWHGLGGDDGARKMVEIGSANQMFHGLALVAVAALGAFGNSRARRLLNVAGFGFTIGVLLFSGALYWFAAFAELPVEGAAPVGGVLLMIGWGALMAAAVCGRRREQTDCG